MTEPRSIGAALAEAGCGFADVVRVVGVRRLAVGVAGVVGGVVGNRTAGGPDWRRRRGTRRSGGGLSQEHRGIVLDR